MEIRFDRLQECTSELDNILKKLTDVRETVNTEALKLLQIPGFSDYHIKMRSIITEIDEHIESVKRFKEALERLSIMYTDNEARIIRMIDGGIRKKSQFSYYTYISDETGFKWGIK